MLAFLDFPQVSRYMPYSSKLLVKARGIENLAGMMIRAEGRDGGQGKTKGYYYRDYR